MGPVAGPILVDEQRGDDPRAEEGSAAGASAEHPGYDRAGADLPHEFSVREVRAWILRPPERSGNRNRERLQRTCCALPRPGHHHGDSPRVPLAAGAAWSNTLPMWIQAGLASVVRNIASGTEATYVVSIGSRRGNTGTAQSAPWPCLHGSGNTSGYERSSSWSPIRTHL